MSRVDNAKILLGSLFSSSLNVLITILLSGKIFYFMKHQKTCRWMTFSVTPQFLEIECVKYFSKVFGVAINPTDRGVIHAVVTETDTLDLGLHFMLRETLKSSLDFAKADVADGHDNQINEDDKIRNAGKHFYSELLSVCFPQYILMTQNTQFLITHELAPVEMEGIRGFVTGCRTG